MSKTVELIIGRTYANESELCHRLIHGLSETEVAFTVVRHRTAPEYISKQSIWPVAKFLAVAEVMIPTPQELARADRKLLSRKKP